MLPIDCKNGLLLIFEKKANNTAGTKPTPLVAASLWIACGFSEPQIRSFCDIVAEVKMNVVKKIIFQ